MFFFGHLKNRRRTSILGDKKTKKMQTFDELKITNTEAWPILERKQSDLEHHQSPTVPMGSRYFDHKKSIF